MFWHGYTDFNVLFDFTGPGTTYSKGPKSAKNSSNCDLYEKVFKIVNFWLHHSNANKLLVQAHRWVVRSSGLGGRRGRAGGQVGQAGGAGGRVGRVGLGGEPTNESSLIVSICQSRSDVFLLARRALSTYNTAILLISLYPKQL
jgi:hypothetical protein